MITKAKRMAKVQTIILPYGERKRLAKEFNTSTVTVYSALTYKTDSPLAKMIRKAALERGGHIFPPSANNIP